MRNIKRQIEHQPDCVLARIMIQILCYYRIVFIKFSGEGPKFKNPIFYESSDVFVFLRKSICDTWVSYTFHCGRMPGVSNLKEEGQSPWLWRFQSIKAGRDKVEQFPSGQPRGREKTQKEPGFHWADCAGFQGEQL